MDYKELVEALKEMLPEKIPYGELVGAPWPYTGQGEMVYEEPEPYFIEQAAAAITELLEEVEKEKQEAKRWCAACAEQYKLIEKLEEERDAAVEQLRGDCEKCLHYMVTWNGCTPDFSCPLSDKCLNGDMWEWNGGKKEE